MKILIDMNLSLTWRGVFRRQGWEALHWSEVGNPRARDSEIMQWALDNGFIVFTHDLDFGAILAATQAKGPGVIQVRAQDVSPVYLGDALIAALVQCETVLRQGALVVIDENRTRVRVLPLSSN